MQQITSDRVEACRKQDGLST